MSDTSSTFFLKQKTKLLKQKTAVNRETVREEKGWSDTPKKRWLWTCGPQFRYWAHKMFQLTILSAAALEETGHNSRWKLASPSLSVHGTLSGDPPPSLQHWKTGTIKAHPPLTHCWGCLRQFSVSSPPQDSPERWHRISEIKLWSQEFSMRSTSSLWTTEGVLGN